MSFNLYHIAQKYPDIAVAVVGLKLAILFTSAFIIEINCMIRYLIALPKILSPTQSLAMNFWELHF